MIMKTKKGVNLNGYISYYEDTPIRPSKSNHSRSTRVASITKLFSTRTNGQGVK